VKRIAPKIVAIDRYAEEIRGQWNQGWSLAGNAESPPTTEGPNP
jgi:hypothetical protein